MPTIYLHNVVMTGSSASLEAAAADPGWNRDTHGEMFAVDREEDDTPARARFAIASTTTTSARVLRSTTLPRVIRS